MSNSLSDVDGAIGPVTYQWQSSPNESTWTAIAGATGASYTTANAGVQLRVVASYSVAGGPTETITSAPTATVGAFHIIQGTIASETINGSGNTPANTLTGNSAANTLSGGAGFDILDGGTDDDTMAGGTGNDVYTVDSAADIIEGVGEGTDRINSSVSYTLSANVETLILTGTAAINGNGNTLANTLTGNTADNTLDGGAGNDILNGLDGSDVMNGGVGADILTGGGAGDRFVFSALAEMGIGAGNRDIITDFISGDRLDFTVLDANNATAGSEAFTMINTAAFGGIAGQLRYSDTAGGITVVQGDVNGDSIADFEVQLTGNHIFAADLLL